MVKKCVNGHYYDGGRFEQCPYCGAKDMTQNSAPEMDMTVPVGFSKPAPAQPVQQPAPQPVSPAFSDDDDDATIPLALYNKRKAAEQEVKAPEQPVDSTDPVKEYQEEDSTLKMELPKAEFMPEQKPEAAPVVTNDIAALVADAISDEKSAEPDVTQQPTAEEVAAADAVMQQEQQAETAAPVPFEAGQNDPTVTQQPTAEEVEAANAVMQQEQQILNQAVQPMPVQPAPVPPMQPAYTQQIPAPYTQQYTEQYQQPNQAVYNGAYGYQQPAAEPKPVAGWLIGLNGATRGSIFELRAGRNFIGRSPDSEILLADDTVSYSRHASVIYEPNTRTFIAQAGESNGLIYVNGEMVLNGAQLSAYDRITVGNTRFLFFPLCSEAFAWEDLDGQD